MRLKIVFLLVACFYISVFSQETIRIDFKKDGRVYEGIGALSAGAFSKLLLDYSKEIRSQIFRLFVQTKIWCWSSAVEG